uniref:ATP8 n=1 Tax=Pandorites podoceroides TaxID=1842081 RepID=A0A9N6YJX1_9CRUS|nr:TPA_asm: ATP8 [Pandorites podoceroides]
MPQMAPAMWFYMLLIMAATSMVVMTMIYFSKNSPPKLFATKNYTFNQITWSW